MEQLPGYGSEPSWPLCIEVEVLACGAEVVWEASSSFARLVGSGRG